MESPIEFGINDVNTIFNEVVNGTCQTKSIVVNCQSVGEKIIVTKQARELLKNGFVSKVANETRDIDLRVFIDFK